MDKLLATAIFVVSFAPSLILCFVISVIVS